LVGDLDFGFGFGFGLGFGLGLGLGGGGGSCTTADLLPNGRPLNPRAWTAT
jgi:hypothetical protein